MRQILVCALVACLVASGSASRPCWGDKPEEPAPCAAKSPKPCQEPSPVCAQASPVCAQPSPVCAHPSPLPSPKPQCDKNLKSSPWRMKFMMYRHCPLLNNRAACFALYLDEAAVSKCKCPDMKINTIDFTLSKTFTDELMVRIVQGAGFWADSETIVTKSKRILRAHNLDISVADVKSMPGGMLPVCLSLADNDVNVVSGKPKDGMIEYTLRGDCKQCCPTAVTAAIPTPKASPCVPKPSPCVPKPKPSPRCEKDKPIIPRCPSPMPSPCVPKPSPCVVAKPSPCMPKPSPCVPKPSPCVPKPSPCVVAKPSPCVPKPSPCVPKPSPCIPKPSPCVVAKPSPCVVAKPSPCVVADPSPCVEEPKPCVEEPKPCDNDDSSATWPGRWVPRW